MEHDRMKEEKLKKLDDERRKEREILEKVKIKIEEEERLRVEKELEQKELERIQNIEKEKIEREKEEMAKKDFLSLSPCKWRENGTFFWLKKNGFDVYPGLKTFDGQTLKDLQNLTFNELKEQLRFFEIENSFHLNNFFQVLHYLKFDPKGKWLINEEKNPRDFSNLSVCDIRLIFSKIGLFDCEVVDRFIINGVYFEYLIKRPNELSKVLHGINADCLNIIEKIKIDVVREKSFYVDLLDSTEKIEEIVVKQDWNFDLLRLLEKSGLSEYIKTFKHHKINGYFPIYFQKEKENLNGKIREFLDILKIKHEHRRSVLSLFWNFKKTESDNFFDIGTSMEFYEQTKVGIDQRGIEVIKKNCLHPYSIFSMDFEEVKSYFNIEDEKGKVILNLILTKKLYRKMEEFKKIIEFDGKRMDEKLNLQETTINPDDVCRNCFEKEFVGVSKPCGCRFCVCCETECHFCKEKIENVVKYKKEEKFELQNLNVLLK